MGAAEAVRSTSLNNYYQFYGQNEESFFWPDCRIPTIILARWKYLHSVCSLYACNVDKQTAVVRINR